MTSELLVESTNCRYIEDDVSQYKFSCTPILMFSIDVLIIPPEIRMALLFMLMFQIAGEGNNMFEHLQKGESKQTEESTRRPPDDEKKQEEE